MQPRWWFGRNREPGTLDGNRNMGRRGSNDWVEHVFGLRSGLWGRFRDFGLDLQDRLT